MTIGKGKRVVLTTFGSLGDLHPYIALALELKKRGHIPTIATSEFYRDRVVPLGLNFVPIRPDQPAFHELPAFMARLMDMRKGTERVVREFIMPALRDSYDDLLAACASADVIISHTLTFAAPLVAEKRQLKWVSAVLQPTGFFSAFDPPVLAPALFLSHLRPLGPRFHKALFWGLKASVNSWVKPIRDLRAELKLSPFTANPIFAGQHSPTLVLAFFARQLAEPQPDWPPQTHVAGFPFFDADGNGELLPELKRFLDAGAPPIVFTLGSAAVYNARGFYNESLSACRALGRRAVLLTGKENDNLSRLPPLTSNEIAVEYASFSTLFPQAAATVHQGGIGTIGQAMRSGRPMLVVPWAHDQPDNAARCARLGIARVLQRRSYKAERVAQELEHLLRDPSYSDKARTIGLAVRAESAVVSACEAIESIL